MHHKRKRAPNRRAGCGMCKPHKMSGFSETKVSKKGFGNVRRQIITREQLSDIQGRAFYDEEGVIPFIDRQHLYPATGKVAHTPFPSCLCSPQLVYEDDLGQEVWAHFNIQ